MEIAIVAEGLPFGPNTLDHYSLGGSETAAMQVAIELGRLGHLVTLFCNLPPVDRADHTPSGSIEKNVRWVNLDHYAGFITNTSVDLLVASRNPKMLELAHQARKAVLWCHDLATHNMFAPALMHVGWNFDEIWTVSEWHRQQIHDITGYPLDNIRATRNGIVDFAYDIIHGPKVPKSLLYSARPERGLENLVKPGGIMERLPEFTLSVTHYENYPEHMKDFYTYLWSRCEELPNVKLLGPKTQLELRNLLNATWAYVYPTVFEEVSCILAREAIEQKCPFITTRIGALPETLEDCAIFVDGDHKTIGSIDWCEQYANVVRRTYSHPDQYNAAVEACGQRNDLYWDDVVKEWLEWSEPDAPSRYSLIWSLIEESDIIPAKALLDEIPEGEMTEAEERLADQLVVLYPYLYGRESFQDYYQRYYDVVEKPKGSRVDPIGTGMHFTPRYRAMAQEIASWPDGCTVLDYGCAEGTIVLNLAKQFPGKNFIGIDFDPSNIELCKQYAGDNEITNCEFYHGSTENWPEEVTEPFDYVIASEIMEHVIEPWKLAYDLEQKAKVGGRLLLTTPQGPWEAIGLYDAKQFWWRAHIWHLDKFAIREMFGNKQNVSMSSAAQGMTKYGRAIGHNIYSYEIDREMPKALDPIEKVKTHRPMQTIGAAIIAMNEEDSILKCLNSIQENVQQIHIALGPSHDNTRQYVEAWAEKHPWIDLKIIDVPPIMPRKYGFDDARNESMSKLETDWVFWIDCDEYLSGLSMRQYARPNCFDSYAIHQHHFTCEPRGEPAQLDKPSRLFRRERFKFYGKVHEHAEIKFNEGPGFCCMLDAIDIGHTGYENEAVRFKRFSRNFPFLEWDRDVNPDRKLGKYLWLRDLIHRIKFAQSEGRIADARLLAKQAVDFYEENHELFDVVGGGAFGNNAALIYYSDAKRFLNEGMEVTINIQLEDGASATYKGVFSDADKALDIAQRSLRQQFEVRNSRYWIHGIRNN